MDARALFYQDSHLCRFTALVTGCHPMPDGWAVSLDRTAFYPEGGGQPWDLGTLGEAQVLAVTEQNGSIVHLCDRELPVGGEVAGCIDWPRRFDFMQQHSGEHLLSGLIHSRYGFHNVGFHMGAGVTTIDFDGVIPQEDLPSLEAAVNEAIWRDLPVRTWFASGQELEKLPYRSKRPLEGTVRLVEFPGMDLCACCGTHVASDRGNRPSEAALLGPVPPGRPDGDGLRPPGSGLPPLRFTPRTAWSARPSPPSPWRPGLPPNAPPRLWRRQRPGPLPWRPAALPPRPAPWQGREMWFSLKRTSPQTACAGWQTLWAMPVRADAASSPARTKRGTVMPSAPQLGAYSPLYRL
ncbi:MAG: alanyl-tRNA editing protein [Oscillospiraceae bacterium]